MTRIKITPGEHFPLGATWDGSGVNFALFSIHAEKVELCLFDPTGTRETGRVVLPEYTHEIWHGYVPDLAPGQRYGYRVYGPYEPREGHRFNPNKLVIDPYAKMLSGALRWDDALFGYELGHPDRDLSFDTRDSAPFMPKCVVVDGRAKWPRPRPEPRPMHETVLYEMHVRGFTMMHPGVRQAHRGTFAGLKSKPVVEYLRKLGVTAIELLPVHAFVDERHLFDTGLTNYWGYNTLAYFAPQPAYLNDGGLDDMREFIQAMHDADIEVILDVVYNHTAEGGRLGPTLSFRGIDNKAYYFLTTQSPRHYADFTGTGNSLDLRNANVMRMVMDSLRYWADDMRVDGFRFDLAPVLARDKGGFDPDADFMTAIAQDPLLSRMKLIAEPWDVGRAGYQVGQFPPGWSEWNDQYRDTMRRFWRGDGGEIGALASRFAGSSDIFEHRGRRPWAGVNFVTAHDGFTLWDLVSYDHKHNEANREDNRDGTDANWSANYGAEGPTDDPAILEIRNRQVRNFLASLLLSQGIPMLTAGDEFRRTQHGNNNAYCQDNEISWIDWSALPANEDLLAFVRKVIHLRRSHIVFHRHRFFHGQVIPGTMSRDITWLRPDGQIMEEGDWFDEGRRVIGILLSGEAGTTHLTARGQPESDDTFFLALNAWTEPLAFTIPGIDADLPWEPVIDTALPSGLSEGGPPVTAGQTVVLEPRSMTVHRQAPRAKVFPLV